MTNSNQPTAATPPQVNFMRAPSFVDIYTNNMRAGATPWDISFTFSRMTDIGNMQFQEDLAVVRMSPQQLKELSKLVAVLLPAWESVFGEIKSFSPERTVEEILPGLVTMRDQQKNKQSSR